MVVPVCRTYVYGYTHTMFHMQETEDNFGVESVFSIYFYLGLGDQPQVTILVLLPAMLSTPLLCLCVPLTSPLFSPLSCFPSYVKTEPMT